MKTLLSVIVLVLTSAIGYSQNDSVHFVDSGVIFLSRDGGDTWLQSDRGFPVEGAVNAFALSGKRIVAGTESHGIYISDDGSKHWWPSNKGLPRAVHIKALAVHDNLLFAGTVMNGIYVSADDGSSWKPVGPGLDFSTVRCLHSTGNRLFAGTDTGIYNQQEDGTWAQVARGFQVNEFTSLNGDIFAATNFGAWRSSDSGKTWSHLWKNKTFFNIAAFNNQLISFTSDDQILTASSAGESWFVLDKNFNNHTFRITPSSGSLLISQWKNVFNSLRNNQPFRGEGLPSDRSFQKILVTPFGILVAVGNSGC